MKRRQGERNIQRRRQKFARAIGAHEWHKNKGKNERKDRLVTRMADPGYDDFSRRRATIGNDKEADQITDGDNTAYQDFIEAQEQERQYAVLEAHYEAERDAFYSQEMDDYWRDTDLWEAHEAHVDAMWEGSEAA